MGISMMTVVTFSPCKEDFLYISREKLYFPLLIQTNLTCIFFIINIYLIFLYICCYVPAATTFMCIPVVFSH